MNLVYISGIFRSGTTLLSSSLDARRGAAVAWQPFFPFWREVRNRFHAEVLGRPLPDDYPMGLYEYVPGQGGERFAGVLDSVRFTSQEAKALGEKLRDYLLARDSFNTGMKPEGLAERVVDLPGGTAGEAFMFLMESFAEWRRGLDGSPPALAGLKEAFCEEFALPVAESDLLKGRSLLIVRDPRAVTASRNYGAYAEACGSRYPLGFIVQMWNRSARHWLEARDHARMLGVRYEDLVLAPEDVFAGIEGFLDVPRDEAMRDTGRYRDGSGKEWQANSSFGSRKGIFAGSLDRWRALLTDRELAFVEAHCGEGMRALGYEPDLAPDEALRVAAGYAEDLDAINPWAWKYTTVGRES